jgi:hypothetical protein
MKYVTRAIIVVVAIIVLIALLPGGNKAPERNLTTTVRSLGASFVIQNNDTFSWGTCDLDLNSDYSIKGVNISAGGELRVPAREFATNDGIRFNAFAMKPQTLYIYCRQTPYGTLSTMVGWK